MVRILASGVPWLRGPRLRRDVGRGVEAEDQHRHLHHALVIEGVPVQAVLAETLAVVAANDDRGGAAAAAEQRDQFGGPRVEIGGGGDLPAVGLMVELPLLGQEARLIEEPPQAESPLDFGIDGLHALVTEGAVGLAVVDEGEAGPFPRLLFQPARQPLVLSRRAHAADLEVLEALAKLRRVAEPIHGGRAQRGVAPSAEAVDDVSLPQGKSDQRLGVHVAVGDPPDLLGVAVIERLRREDVGQKTIEHRLVSGERVGGHRPGPPRLAELIQRRRASLEIGVVAARIPGHQEEVLGIVEDLVLLAPEKIEPAHINTRR